MDLLLFDKLDTFLICEILTFLTIDEILRLQNDSTQFHLLFPRHSIDVFDHWLNYYINDVKERGKNLIERVIGGLDVEPAIPKPCFKIDFLREPDQVRKDFTGGYIESLAFNKNLYNITNHKKNVIVVEPRALNLCGKIKKIKVCLETVRDEFMFNYGKHGLEFAG